MQVKHGLSRLRPHIQHRSVSILDLPIATDLSSHQMAAAYDLRILLCSVLQINQMLLGDDQYMCGSLGINVLKGVRVLVFVNFFRRNLSGDDFAE